MAGKKIGVLALQGAFIEHEEALKKCGAQVVEVRTVQDLESIDGLIIPGGESTTIGKLLVDYKLDSTVLEKAKAGMPIWGTCAGMILMAKEIAESDQFRLGLMDISVRRNAFGRQVDSFETDLDINGLGTTRAIFIRAPYVDRYWGEAQMLASYREKIVMVRQGNYLATAFHPELTPDYSVHQFFLNMV
ncbi:MAG TPA: pyridoxal 5'-phosphate synthase glutaminase subunit PdxT [Syntrophomonadaceae bacterium]|nr:pyridoxal 5'-phosphate synthase glutaminase subunit PdxT [Syntrophomonadaceae bacterium]